jgi:PadR family transcriptional regulator PadR
MRQKGRKTLTEEPRKQIVQRMISNFLDILILRLLQIEPMWGYKIIKKIRVLFEVNLGHGALYPLLNSLEKEGYTRSEKITKAGRTRKMYNITPEGTRLVDVYYSFLKEQLKKKDIEEA